MLKRRVMNNNRIITIPAFDGWGVKSPKGKFHKRNLDLKNQVLNFHIYGGLLNFKGVK